MKYIFLGVFIIVTIYSCNNNSTLQDDSALIDIKNSEDTNTVTGITRLIRENPKNASLFAKRSKLYMQNGYIEDALNDISLAIRLDSLNPDYYVKNAELYLLQGKSGKAKDILQKCITLIPGNIESMLKLAEIYLFIPDHKKVFEELEEIKKIDPNHYRIYFLAGMNFVDMGDTAKAIENFQIAIEKNPDMYDAYIMLGLLYAGQKDTLALDYYNNALKINNKSLEAYYNKAMFLQSIGRYDKAIEIYRFIIDSVNSDYKYAYYNIGYINMVYLKDYDQGIEFFSKAIELDNKYAEAYYNKGVCYEMKSNYPKARLEYQTALRIKENYDKAIEGLNRIEGK